MMVQYLGIKRDREDKNSARTVWYIPSYEADQAYRDVEEGKVDVRVRTVLAVFPGRFDNSLAPLQYECVNIEVLVPFVSDSFWKDAKDPLAEKVLKRAEEFIPNLGERVVVREIATPVTIQRYTRNDFGAIYGLASTMSQTKSSVMPQRTIIPGLYLASHWSTIGTGQGGTQTSAYAGRRAAELVLAKLRQATAMVGSSA